MFLGMFFAKTTFCKDYTDIAKEYLASESRMVQILETINMDSKTFRALVKPRKISRLLYATFISIFRRNSEYSLSNNVSITDAFQLEITEETLVILRVTQGILNSDVFTNLYIISIVHKQDLPVVLNNVDLFTKLESFIKLSLKVYQGQITLNIQSVEVGNQIIELLKALPSNEINTQVNSNNPSLEDIDMSPVSENSPERKMDISCQVYVCC